MAQTPAANKNTLADFEKSIEQGDFAAVERNLLNYAIANPNDANGFELLARLRFGQNRLNQAKSLYQKALSLDPNLTSAKINLAVLNFQIGNSEEAISDLNEIPEKDISGDSLHLKMASAFALVGDCRKALAAIEKLGIKTKNNNALPIRAECFLKTNEKQKIAALIPSVKILARKNPEIAVKFAEVLSGGAMFKESADVLRSVIKIFPNNFDALILLAKSEIYLKDLPDAKVHLASASKINPNSSELFFVQSLFESEQGNFSISLNLLEKTLAANPDSTTVLSQFVITAMRANQAGKAVKAAEKLIELKPDEPDVLYLYGASLLQNNKLQTAETVLDRLAELRPNDSRGCLMLGLAYAAQPAKFEDARRQLRRCIEINPNDFESKYQLGLSYKTQGEIQKAIEYLEAAIKNSPDYAPALRDLGAMYLQSGAEAKARLVLEKSAALNPNDADTHFQLSRLYNLIGETALGKKHLEIFQNLRNPKKDGM